MARLVLFAAVLIVACLVASPAPAGPLMDPRQCRVLLANLERVTSISEQEKRAEFLACMGRADSMRRAMGRMNNDRAEAIRLKKTLDNEPQPERPVEH